MQRIETQDGRFAAGNPQTGTPGTMVSSVFMNDIQDEIVHAIEAAGLELDSEDTYQLSKAIDAKIAVKSMLVVPTTPAEQLSSKLLFVEDMDTFARWVSTPHYTGYRNLYCGELKFGTTLLPGPGQIEAEGDIIDGALYPSLVAFFTEQGLVVPIANWIPGEYKLGDMGDGQYRLPDMRDMFLRFTGTDADTANARVLGSKQLDALQNFTGALTNQVFSGSATNPSGVFSVSGTLGPTFASGASGNVRDVDFDASNIARTSTETRGPNAAFLPVINL
ncbi:MAG: hypothetical protein CL536_10985 [Alcaligenaceae bacterium]|nr:hypothetical protein [Alcaligenaceae bacterium]